MSPRGVERLGHHGLPFRVARIELHEAAAHVQRVVGGRQGGLVAAHQAENRASELAVLDQRGEELGAFGGVVEQSLVDALGGLGGGQGPVQVPLVVQHPGDMVEGAAPPEGDVLVSVGGNLLVVVERLPGHPLQGLEAAQGLELTGQVFDHERHQVLGLGAGSHRFVLGLDGGGTLAPHVHRVLEAGSDHRQRHRGRQGVADASFPLVPDPPEPLLGFPCRGALAGVEAEEPGEERRQVLRHPLGRAPLARLDPLEEGEWVEALREGGLAREELLEHGPQGVHVARRRHRLPADLLRAHEAGRSLDPSELAPVVVDERGPVGRLDLPVDQPVGDRDGLGGVRAGDAEVQHLDGAVVGDHHVLGFEVPVDDAPGVGRGQGVADPVRDLEFPVLPEVGLEGLPQGAALDQLQDEEVRVLALDEVVDVADVGVVQQGEDLRLFEETLLDARLHAVPRPHGLEGDPSPELLVVAGVDVAVAARADQLDDADVSDSGAEEGHRSASREGCCMVARVYYVPGETRIVRRPPVEGGDRA